MTIYSLDILLFLFGTSLLFHVQFYLLLPDLHIGFSRGRSGGLVFHLLTAQLHSSHTLVGEGNGTPLQHSCLENPTDRGAWWATVHGVAKSRTRLSDFTFTFHLLTLEKEMATHSSVLAWRIPGTGEPCGLPSMGSHRVGHD